MKIRMTGVSRVWFLGMAAVAVMLAGTQPAAGGYYALLVGVADYPGYINDLKYCDDDAMDMRDALTRRSNWSSANITTLLNSQATYGQIVASINALDARMSSSDTFVFFYAGHGIATPDVYPYDETDGLD